MPGSSTERATSRPVTEISSNWYLDFHGSILSSLEKEAHDLHFSSGYQGVSVKVTVISSMPVFLWCNWGVTWMSFLDWDDFLWTVFTKHRCYCMTFIKRIKQATSSSEINCFLWTAPCTWLKLAQLSPNTGIFYKTAHQNPEVEQRSRFSRGSTTTAEEATNVILQGSLPWLKPVFYLHYQFSFYVAFYVWEALPSKQIVLCGLLSIQPPKEVGWF